MYLIETTKDLIELARAEISCYFEILESFKNFFVISENSDLKNFEKLGFSKNLYEILFSSSKESFLEKIRFSSVREKIPSEFFLSSIDNNSRMNEFKRKLGIILEDINHRVNFKGSPLYLLENNESLYLLKRIKRNNIDYNNFRNSIIPINSATLLDTKLAKAMLNLAKINKDDILLDPFCGAGGILIEASKFNIKVIGNDLFHIQLRKAKMNLIWFRCNNVILVSSNALDCQKLADIIKPTKIVTDFPYGFRSKIREELKELINSILLLRKRCVFLCINNLEIDSFVKERCKELNLKIESEFLIPVNTSFSRKLYVIDIL